MAASDMQTAFEHCEQQVRDADKDRFLATLFAPAPLRGPLHALYAFDREIAGARDRITSPLPGEVRLQWWRDVLTGTAHGDAAANPVAAALLETVARFALPVPTLLDLIDAHTFDLYDEPMATVADLERYADATAANILRLAGHILVGERTAALDDLMRHAGVALTLTDAMSQLPVHAARGQLFLPEDILATHGVLEADIFAGRASQPLRAALVELRSLVGRQLAAIRERVADIPPPFWPALLPLAPLPLVLHRLARDDPFQPQPLSQWRRQWRMWRAARRPRRFLA
jgi:phytoene synthase